MAADEPKRRTIKYPKTRAKPKATRPRKRHDPARVSERIKSYQAKGLGPKAALTELRKRGKVGMSTQRFYALYRDMLEDPGTQRRIRQGEKGIRSYDLKTKRKGWLYFVRVKTLDKRLQVEDFMVPVESRKRISVTDAVAYAIDRVKSQASKYARSIVGGEVVTLQRMVTE